MKPIGSDLVASVIYTQLDNNKCYKIKNAASAELHVCFLGSVLVNFYHIFTQPGGEGRPSHLSYRPRD